jgi:hypothetical protein
MSLELRSLYCLIAHVLQIFSTKPRGSNHILLHFYGRVMNRVIVNVVRKTKHETGHMLSNARTPMERIHLQRLYVHRRQNHVVREHIDMMSGRVIGTGQRFGTPGSLPYADLGCVQVRPEWVLTTG